MLKNNLLFFVWFFFTTKISLLTVPFVFLLKYNTVMNFRGIIEQYNNIYLNTVKRTVDILIFVVNKKQDFFSVFYR